MTLYAFILGRKNLLSTAELCNVFSDEHHIIDIQNETMIASCERPLRRPQESLDRLGGTMKIAEVFAEFPLTLENLASPVSAYLVETFQNQSSKLTYGLSIYNFAQRNDPIIKKVLNRVKTDLKAAGIKSRFINKGFQNLKNAAIKGEKLVEKGAEILIIEGKHKLFFAKTVAVQDFESYSHRDYDRPARDAKLGMLPPKLAQIMINCGGYTHLSKATPKGITLYDPFAGIGTVLTEGLLLEYNVVGSDISQKVLDGAQENLFWTYQNDRSIQRTSRLFQKDATSISKKDCPEEINLIITESYLGPPVKKLPDKKQMKKNFQHIEETITRFFRAVHKVVKPKTPVIISFPIYRDKRTFHSIKSLPEKIEKLGYHIEPLIPRSVAAKFGVKADESLIYDRPNQIVGREIWKFIRK